MQLHGTRALVVGATGVLGGTLADALSGAGARLVVAGRDPDRLRVAAERLGGVPAHVLDVLDLDACRDVVARADTDLGGLDLVLVASGIAAFGPAAEEDDLSTETLFAVNTIAPMTIARAAAGRLTEGGAIAVLSAILADYPTPGMAAYSASKTALSAWLGLLRRELRPSRIGVFDIRPPHIETGLAGRAIAGTAPKMPRATDLHVVVEEILRGLREDRRELTADPRTGELSLG